LDFFHMMVFYTYKAIYHITKKNKVILDKHEHICLYKAVHAEHITFHCRVDVVAVVDRFVMFDRLPYTLKMNQAI